MPSHVSALAVGHSLYEYRIERLLGHGGFGLTYLAQDTNLNAFVAIKEFLPQEFATRAANSSVIPKSESDTEPYQWGLERFKEEARALARFKHPNIVRAARLIEANGTAYMVMDFEPGMTLSQYLKRVSPVLDEAQVLGLFLPVLDGLEALHSMELVHRDIKPGNIYLRVRGGPMLIDFGAVRHAIGVHSRSLTAVVTPGYAPIEQYSSDGRQGPWSDLYAVGATMYSCLFGHPPVDAARRSAAISDGGDDPQGSATTLGAGRFSPELLQAVDWALHFRVRDRPQSAEAFRGKLGASPARPQALTVPKDLEDEPGMHHGVASDRSKQPVQVPAAELKSRPPAADSAVMLRAHSGPPKEADPDKTDVGAVAKALDARSVPSATPKETAEALDLELPAAEAPAATEVMGKSPILEKMGSGIRRAQTVKLTTPKAPEPVPATASPRTSRPKTVRPLPAPPPRRIPYKYIALAVITLALAGAGAFFYLNQRAAEEEQYGQAAEVNTLASYQLYLQDCHLCPHRAAAQQAIAALENADKFTRLRTEFELLLLRKALQPPAQPNASGVLYEMQNLKPSDPHLAQAHTLLTDALSHPEVKPRSPAPALKSSPAAVPLSPSPVAKPSPTPAPPPAAPVTQSQGVAAKAAASTMKSLVTTPAATPSKPKPKPQPAQSAPAPAPVAAPVQPAAPAAPVVREPQAVYTPAPQYPRDALLSRQQGWVDVEFTVNTDGSVSDAEVAQAQPAMIFNKAALRAVGSWRFTPYTVNGVAQVKRMRLRVEFKP